MMQSMGMGMGMRMQMRPISINEIFARAFAGLEGTADNLAQMLNKFPQRSENGDLKYLLAGGWAVELLTGSEREHEDIDVICVDEEHLSIYNTSVGSSNANDERASLYYALHFGEIPTKSIKRNYIQEINWERTNLPVVIPSTEFLLLSKIIRSLREKDFYDVSMIFATQDIDQNKLVNIIQGMGIDNSMEHASQIYSLSANLKNPATSSQAFKELENYEGLIRF